MIKFIVIRTVDQEMDRRVKSMEQGMALIGGEVETMAAYEKCVIIIAAPRPWRV